MRGTKHRFFLIITLLLLFATACNTGSQRTDNTKSPSVLDAPIELTLFYPYNEKTRDMFMEEVGNYIFKKYPNISFNYVFNEKDSSFESLIASGFEPDIVLTTTSAHAGLLSVGWDGDISDLAKKYNYDFGKLNPAVYKGIQGSKPGEIMGLPSHVNTMALFYNKDLFDKFGVPYLKDGMTWDEIYDVAKTLTRTDGGTVYRGLGFRNSNFIPLNQLSLPLVDKANRAAFNTDKWKEYMANFTRFYQIPGFEATAENISGRRIGDMFLKEQTLAMMVTQQSDYPRASLGVKANWDVAAYPTLMSNPGVGAQPNIVFYVIPKASKKRDAAFLALTAISDEEQQRRMVRDGYGTVLNKDVIPEANTGDLKGKNVQALSPKKYADPIEPSRFTSVASSQIFGGVFNQVSLGLKDMNTAFRDAVESTNKRIDEQLSK